MTARHRLFWASAALLGVLSVVVLMSPRWVEHKIRTKLAAYPELEFEGLRVRPFLAIELDTLHLNFEEAGGACHNIVLRPRFARKAAAPRLRHVEIERCELRITLAASDEDSDALKDISEKTPNSTGERLEAAYARIASKLEVARTIDIQRLQLRVEHPKGELTAELKDLHWQQRHWNQELPNHRASARARFSGDFESGGVAVELKIKDGSNRLEMQTEEPFVRAERRLQMEQLAVVDWRSVEIEALELLSPGTLIERTRLETVRLALDETMLVQSERGELHLSHADLATTILAEASPDGVPLELHRLSDDEAADPEQLWSLRTLSRARRLVARLDEVLHDPTAKLPLNVDLQRVDIHHDGEALMRIERARFTDDEPLFMDARIGDAQLSLRADPDDVGLWHLDSSDASLKRIASFFEMDEHLDGRVDAKLVFRVMNETLTIGGELALRNGVINHPSVSPEPVTPLHIDGILSASLPADPHAEVHAQYSVRVNELPLTMSLRVVPVGERARFIAYVDMDEKTDCQQIWEAIPKGLVPELGHSSVQFRGAAKPKFSLNYVAGVFDSFALDVEGFPERCKIDVHPLRFDPKRLNRNDYTFHVSEGVSSNAIFVGPGVEDYVRIGTLPTYVPAVMYLSEEINFYNNHGMSLGLINKAIRHSLPRRRFAYGGSTVTQQLMKNLYFSRTKTLARKLQEAVIVWAVESNVSKDRILELYLNVIEFGPDLYGIVRASRHYFDKEPAELTPLEATWLASLKPSPVRGRRDFQRGHSDFENWNSQRNEELLRRLVRYGEHIQPEEVDAAAPFVVFFPKSPNAGAKPPDYDAHVEALLAERVAAALAAEAAEHAEALAKEDED